MGSLWIIGRKATIASNGHNYMTEPFIAFSTEELADEACDMIERISGERPMKAEASMQLRGSAQRAGLAGGTARARKLSPERRKEIASKAASARWAKP